MAKTNQEREVLAKQIICSDVREEDGKIENELTLVFESGRSYKKIFFGEGDDPLMDIEIGEEVLVTLSSANHIIRVERLPFKA